jgi:hypothetical protein
VAKFRATYDYTRGDPLRVEFKEILFEADFIAYDEYGRVTGWKGDDELVFIGGPHKLRAVVKEGG